GMRPAWRWSWRPSAASPTQYGFGDRNAPGVVNTLEDVIVPQPATNLRDAINTRFEFAFHSLNRYAIATLRVFF
ncbi:MAG: hypothetical protein ABSA52_25465, partial [Candidatus Binatia bacterium]